MDECGTRCTCVWYKVSMCVIKVSMHVRKGVDVCGKDVDVCGHGVDVCSKGVWRVLSLYMLQYVDALRSRHVQRVSCV